MRHALSLLVICAATATASADGLYVTESFGGSDIKGELAERMSSGFRIKIALGMRRGRWALQTWLADNIDTSASVEGAPCRACDASSTYAPEQSLLTYGVEAKYLQPVANHVEVYLRGGISRGSLRHSGDGDHAGRGLVGGAGVQLKGKVRALGFLAWPLFFTGVGPKITGALYLDAGYEFYRLHPGGRLDAPRAIDATVTSITFGFAAGSDF